MPATKEAGFEPKGLPGYRVFQDPKWAGAPAGDWFFTNGADPHSFEWNEADQAHTTPIYRDWAHGPRKSAKGAVAAAHAHRAFVTKAVSQ